MSFSFNIYNIITVTKCLYNPDHKFYSLSVIIRLLMHLRQNRKNSNYYKVLRN